MKKNIWAQAQSPTNSVPGKIQLRVPHDIFVDANCTHVKKKISNFWAFWKTFSKQRPRKVILFASAIIKLHARLK